MIKLFIFVCVVLLSGCTGEYVKNETALPSPTPVAVQTPTPVIYTMNSWSNSLWSEILQDKVREKFDDLVKATDWSELCPSFDKKDKDKKIFAMAELFVWLSYYESRWNHVSRFTEVDLGIDPVTKKQVVSEGLFQLSYQDVRGYPFCEFNWELDKMRDDKDPEKTILMPKNNIECAVGIMAKQISKRGKVLLSSNVYWSVLKVSGKYNRIQQIKQKLGGICAN